MSKLKLEVGKRYVDKRNVVYGPMVPYDNYAASKFKFQCKLSREVFTFDGCWRGDGEPDTRDLIAEYEKPVPEETHGKENTIQLQPMATAPKDRWIMICVYRSGDKKSPTVLVRSHWCVWTKEFISTDRSGSPNLLGWMEVPTMPQENSNAQD